LHRIGYVATLIVIAEVCSVGWFVGEAWMRSRQIADAQRENTRTHAGPLTAQHNDIVREGSLKLLDELPALNTLGGDAARFVAMPSFGKRWFAIAVRADGNSARGVLITMEHSGTDNVGTPSTQAFRIPISAYKAVTTQTDRIAHGWAGETGFWTDGTAFGFELVRGSSVISGIGNSPTHYGQIASAVRNGLAPYVPAIARLDSEWIDYESSSQQ
jgi:hypothetical protein